MSVRFLRLLMILTTGASGVALTWAGLAVAGVGETRLGFGIAWVGVGVFVLAAQVGV